MNICNTTRNVIRLFFLITIWWLFLAPLYTIIGWPVAFFIADGDCSEGKRDANSYVKWIWTGKF